ncbi:Heterokaryon incompatibility [Fusarium oxysporum f. sp. vasinfectum]|nr:Heterokaryon incompatibility [Fusarium oxysporum f. sp. vasinfectum]
MGRPDDNTGYTGLPPLKRARVQGYVCRCDACTRLFSQQGLQDLNSSSGFAHKTRQGLLSSVRAGCDLCKFIFEVALKEFGHHIWENGDLLRFWNSKSDTGGKSSYIDALNGRVNGLIGGIKLYPFVEENDPLFTLISRRPLRRDVSSPEAYSSATKLIEACLRTDAPSRGHQKCRYSRDIVLPTRVIRVSGHTAQLQINETEARGTYLALSYCWGKPDPKMQSRLSELRLDNEQDLVKEIKVGELEQSVQDAIHVTRELGFAYLWVDRLCIVQNCPEDKRREIDKMATTYKNAAITLAAGTATRASEGFLGILPDKSPTYLPENQFDIPMKDGRIGTVYLSGSPYQPDHPLDKRGWTLQEYLLSSRMLIFSDYQLLWQCQETELQSVAGSNVGIEYQQHLESLPWASFDEQGEPSYGTHDSEKLYLWKTIIFQFTQRQLKDPEDRLPAVTGITTELQKVWRDSHIYGHWERWFIQLLAWYKPYNGRVKERHTKRAPSWSWVSVDGRIRFEDPMELEDAKIEILTAAKVRLSCRILQLSDISLHKRCTLSTMLDLVESASDTEFAGRKCEYLLLGKTSRYHEETGVALMILKTPSGSYRRVGLALFDDMTVWTSVKFQSVDLEPKEK